ncbi:hypothetical protein [Actinobacillus lignieresii]|uniref:Uncharacterized protein n=1 Tax=Actinobacillus lignieresii TaxID=720 RepID=A0A380U1H8_ACTLI|nr:hypothetical protein [Actinobacillus lignieresii]SUT94912.1 Uncharacterised protein [Actinobacillus lignieresii]
MKELNIKDCEIVTGGVAPLVWAAAGVATYLGTKLYSGEDITAIGVVSSAIGGSIGGGISAIARTSTTLRPIVGGFAGGAAEGFVNSSYQGMKSNNSPSSSTRNQSGSDYGDGCNYQ